MDFELDVLSIRIEFTVSPVRQSGVRPYSMLNVQASVWYDSRSDW